MDVVCLLVDVDQEDLVDQWEDLTASVEFPMPIKYVAPDEVEPMISAGGVVMMVMFSMVGNTNEVCRLLEIFRSRVGPLPHFQGIICSEPSPHFLTDVFEYGIEHFISEETWPQDVAAQARDVLRILEDDSCSESKVIKLSISISNGDQGGVAEAEQALGDSHEYDYLAAYSKASALQAIGKFSEAADVYRNSGTMNKYFRPAKSKLGENLMVVGKTEEAIQIFENWISEYFRPVGFNDPR